MCTIKSNDILLQIFVQVLFPYLEVWPLVRVLAPAVLQAGTDEVEAVLQGFKARPGVEQ